MTATARRDGHPGKMCQLTITSTVTVVRETHASWTKAINAFDRAAKRERVGFGRPNPTGTISYGPVDDTAPKYDWYLRIRPSGGVQRSRTPFQQEK